MADEVKVRKRKSAKHGMTYEYRFEVASINGERKWISRGGFISEKEAKKEGLKAWKSYRTCGLQERSSSISYADFLDDWLETDCRSNLKAFHLRTYHGRCTKLQAYLDEFCFQFICRLTGKQVFLRLTKAVATFCGMLS